ncbi:hypothetical protein JG687_00006473 [Phytophthora cactorum]|uniref:Uncharacterized protein n=1 Tax=Phytophthora cactorum TaxID=29920 RepID=A0A8T1UJC7_9STRA|nr:hypothetical protein JG687_00006473 [Phytophthora cactorum]
MAATEQGWVSADQQAVAEEDGEAVCGPAPHRAHEDRGETANASLASDVLAGLAVFLMRELQAQRAGSIGRTSTSVRERGTFFVPLSADMRREVSCVPIGESCLL